MSVNLSSGPRPSLTGVRELTAAGRLAAWGTAALTGAVSPDEAADEVSGPHDPAHRVTGLPGEAAAVNLPYALARLRALGVTGLRLVLPRPGDTAGLPGPPSFNELAVLAGDAAITVGGTALGLLPGVRGSWSVHAVSLDVRTPQSLAEAGRALGAAMREATELLVRLDLSRWEPAAADVLAARSRAERPALPMSVPVPAHSVLHQALRVAAIVAVATTGDGAAVTAAEMSARSTALRGLDTASRRAIEAACSPAPS